MGDPVGEGRIALTVLGYCVETAEVSKRFKVLAATFHSCQRLLK